MIHSNTQLLCIRQKNTTYETNIKDAFEYERKKRESPLNRKKEEEKEKKSTYKIKQNKKRKEREIKPPL